MKYYFTSEGYCHKELLRRCCRHPGSASDGSAIYTRHSLGLLLQNRKIVYFCRGGSRSPFNISDGSF